MGPDVFHMYQAAQFLVCRAGQYSDFIIIVCPAFAICGRFPLQSFIKKNFLTRLYIRASVRIAYERLHLQDNWISSCAFILSNRCPRAQIRFSFYGLLPLFQLHILPGICFSSAAELGFTIHGSFFLSKHFPNVVDFLPHQWYFFTRTSTGSCRCKRVLCTVLYSSRGSNCCWLNSPIVLDLT